MSGRGSRGRVPGHGGGRDSPGQARQPEPGLDRRDQAVRAHDDGQSGVGRQGLQAGGPCVAGEADVDPAGVRVRAGSSLGAWCAADPHQDQAVPAAEVHQVGAGPLGGQHGGASGQDRVQPDGGAVSGGDQRVGDQAAGPQRGGAAIPAACAASVAACSIEVLTLASVTASCAPHAQRGQRVGDPGHRAGQLRVGPVQAAGGIARVGDPLRGDAVRPAAGRVQQQLVGRLRPRQCFFLSCGHGSFPIIVLCWVPRSSPPPGEAIVAVITSPSRR